jgi:TRAP-type mannitol/chloroaromatic compound transport system permease large subunit
VKSVILNSVAVQMIWELCSNGSWVFGTVLELRSSAVGYSWVWNSVVFLLGFLEQYWNSVAVQLGMELRSNGSWVFWNSIGTL